MKFSLEWLNDHVDVEAGGGAAGVRALLEQAGLPAESASQSGSDTILEVEITPNRPDAMGHRGLAREVAAMAGIACRPVPEGEPLSSGESVERLASVINQVPRLCRRFGVRMIRGVRNGPAPERVRSRLMRLGMKAISSAVDATNYGLWDTGQPLHAFDFDKLAGGMLIVRKAEKGERLVTLDGIERQLTASDLVVADAERAVSLAGVMGGLETSVTESTRNVLLEAAWWDPITVRRTSRRLGLHTDASHRFERGADLEAIPGALDLAARLVLEGSGGTLAPGLLDARGNPFRVRRAALRLARLHLLSGDDTLTLDFAEEALRRLGFGVERRGRRLNVSIPLFRQDVRGEDDLVEEVLRVHGYHRLPSRLPPSTGAGRYLEPLREVEERVADAAANAGLFETVSFPFADPAEERPFDPWLALSGAAAERIRLRLSNPLDEGRRHLRATLLPGLLDALSHNARQGRADAGLFEIGRAFDREGRPEEPESFESRRLAFALCGEMRTHWSEPPATRNADFFDARGILERLLYPWMAPEALLWSPFDAEAFAPGAAALARSSSGAVLAVVGAVARAERERRRLPERVFAGEVVLAAIPPGPRATYRPYSVFPPIVADLSFAQRRELPWGDVDRFVLEQQLRNLESLRLLDRYEGRGVSEGTIKTTLRLIFRSPDRTLEQDEVNTEVERLGRALQERFGVVL
ncbi:MAG TPA: phenylalanine--tRNA ligase subunit beta [Thermoanaerobaculia bacterium]|nr:phenylalanine--tRNA ligase subunit beta [Thermoanaerobaculia bacterium]